MEDKRPLLDEGAELVETKKGGKDIYSISPAQLEDIVEKYIQRTFDEEIAHIQACKGPEHIAFSCGSHIQNGIASKSERSREQFYGHNKNKEVEREGFWNMWLGALDDLMLKILIVAAIVSMIISAIFEEENKLIACIEGGAILLAVAVVSFVTAWNDYKKEEQFIALTKFNDDKNQVTVIRDGKEQDTNVQKLLVGDLVKIQAGMSIPVDGILIRGSGVTCDEAAMTGESDEMHKDVIQNCFHKLNEILEEEKES